MAADLNTQEMHHGTKSIKETHETTSLTDHINRDCVCLYHSGTRIQQKDRVGVFLVDLYSILFFSISVTLSKVSNSLVEFRLNAFPFLLNDIGLIVSPVFSNQSINQSINNHGASEYRHSSRSLFTLSTTVVGSEGFLLILNDSEEGKQKTLN